MWIDKKRLKKSWLWVRIRKLRLKRWWFKQDRRYGVWWRLGNFAAAVLILVSIVIPVVQQFISDSSYKLSADALTLVGKTDTQLTKQLTYDGKTATYQFNKDAIKDDSANPLAALKSQVGTASGQKKDKSLYALDVPADFSKGVTYHDINSQLSFSLVPKFTASAGKTVDGHLVYPLRGGNQAVYTLKNNGLKEDIVVPKPASDTMTFNYTLNLPKTLEAKIIPDSGGAIGIYSGDPSLFGDISYGSDADRARVETARENAAKSYLVFGMPAPVIKNTSGADVGSGHFVLNGQQLSVVASDLHGINTPITIDPSVVVTSTADFQAGNNDGNIDFSTTDQITRGALTGGSLSNGWTSTTPTGATPAYNMMTAVYNGYLYQVDGYNGSAVTFASYAPLNSNGTLGSWTSATTPNIARFDHGVAAYNGYLYAYGGYNTTSGALSSVEYAKINSNGSLSSWTTSPNAMSAAVCRAGFTVYQGYLYSLGGITTAGSNCGNSGSTPSSIVQYAPLNADGTVGTWATTTTFTYATGVFAGDGAQGLKAVAYNGYMYVMGGTYNGVSTSTYKKVQYARINTDGTLGSWVNGADMLAADYRFSLTAYNGYLYRTGGLLNPTEVDYAPIYSGGAVGTWRQSTSLASNRHSSGLVGYNGYIYLTGGADTSLNCTGPGNNTCSDTQYAKIDVAGAASTFSTFGGTNFTTTRRGGQSVAYNGKLYELGGDNGAAPANTIYAATINNDGTLGGFSATGMTAFTSANGGPGGLTYFKAFAYNGFMYLVGGCTNTYASCGTSGSSAGVYMSAISSTGTLGTWSAQTSLPTAVYGAAVAVSGNTVYVMGGVSTSTFQTAIYYQTFGASGVLTGSWSTSARTVPTSNQAYAGALATGGYMYLIGGCSAGATTCSTNTTNVYYAPITPNGDITSAFTLTGSFTTARGDMGAYAINGTLYLSGGRNNTTYYSDTQFAPINTNGSVGTWVTSSASTLATARYGVGAATYGNTAYILGGYNGTTYYATTLYAFTNNGGGGMTNTWATTASFINTRSDHATVAYNGYLYIAGGNSGGATRYNDVQYAPFNPDGTVGAWHYTHASTDDGTTFVAGFMNARDGLQAVAYNGKLYLLGGQNTTGAGVTYNDVQYAAINTDGTIGSWHYTHASTDDGTTFVAGFSTSRFDHQSVAYKGYLYVIGGVNGSTPLNDVQYAPINTDGTIGTWTATTSFTTARYAPAAVAYNGYLYIAGGYTTDSTNDVQYAAINSNGTIGTWTATTSFNGNRSSATLTVYGGFLYLLGGINASAVTFSDVQVAPILSSGKLGQWQTSTTGFTTSRSAHTSALYNGYVYVTGGTTGSTTLNDVQYASLNTVARIGQYSKLIDLGSAVNVSGVTYNGNLPDSSKVMIRAAGSNGVYGTPTVASNLTGAGGCYGSTTFTRYLLVLVTLDDSGLSGNGAFQDSSGTAANLTDFTVNYNPVHPPPNIRLRAGQTLQLGNLSPLDTCFP